MKFASHPNPLLRHLLFPVGVPNSNLAYRTSRRILQLTIGPYWGVRAINRHYEPPTGSCAYICNHQSLMDPILMAFALRRPVNFMARDTLFQIPFFKHIIAMVNAFPVKRNTADTGAIKEAIRRLKDGGQVVVFAEGTRTKTGHIDKFLPGVAMLAQRFADWTIPVVIDGAFDAWPRKNPLPGPGSVVVQYAPPISREQAKKMPSGEFLDNVRSTIIEMQTDIRNRMHRPPLQY